MTPRMDGPSPAPMDPCWVSDDALLNSLTPPPPASSLKLPRPFCAVVFCAAPPAAPPNIPHAVLTPPTPRFIACDIWRL